MQIKQKKTIFISISRGGLAKNILRTGILELLLKEKLKIIILVPLKIHKYFIDEFAHSNIFFEVLREHEKSKIRKFFNILFNGLVYTKTEHRRIKFGGGRKKSNSKIVYLCKHLLFSIISRIKILKKLARWLEFNVFINKEFDYLFQKYKPNLVFCSSIYSGQDVILIRTAKRLKIKSIGMPKSWDTVSRLFFRVPPDKMVLNNQFMKNWINREQLIKKKDIYICGFPQFDIYHNKNKYFKKDELCKLINLDRNKKIILLASEGIWTHWDKVYIDDLINNYNINKKYNLILRPHWSNIYNDVYKRYKGISGIYVDDKNIRITKMFGDKWDPSKENMNWLAEMLNLSDVVITFMSTFVLDSFVNNKPVINIYYDLPQSTKYIKNGPIIPMKHMYNSTHYCEVLNEQSVVLAKNGKEVMDSIVLYLKNKNLHKKERQNTIDKLCYKLDGSSAKRIAEIIKSNL